MVADKKRLTFDELQAVLGPLESECPFAFLVDDGGGLAIAENTENLDQLKELHELFTVMVCKQIAQEEGPATAAGYLEGLCAGGIQALGHSHLRDRVQSYQEKANA